MAADAVVKIGRWLGLNENPVGDLALKPGEGVICDNFRVTGEGYLQLRPGFLKRAELDGPVRGLWRGIIAGEDFTLAAAGGKLWRIGSVPEEIGEIGSEEAPCFMPFGGKLYILDRADYLVFDGAALTSVEGYIPIVASATTPAGGASLLEEINLLTPKKRQLFSADGTAKIFRMLEKEIAGIEWVKVNGTVSTAYTAQLAAGTITFTSAPSVGVDNVEICWSKATNDRQAVVSMRFGETFGGANDTRMFFGGNSNRIIHTGLASGMPAGDYFPAMGFLDVGTANTPVTALVRHYDRLLALKTGEAYIVGYGTQTTDTGAFEAAFTCLPLNSKVGCVSNGCALLIDNDPLSLSGGGLFRWRTTATRDERNAQLISQRVGQTLGDMVTDRIRMCDVEERRELFVAQGGRMLIYNYEADVFYRYSLGNDAEISAVINDGGAITAGLSDGRILTQNERARSDDGESIKALFESGEMDFGAEQIKKSLKKAYILMKPVSGGRIEVRFRASRGEDWQSVAAASLINFVNCDLKHFSFGANRRARTIRLRLKPRSFTHLKLMLSSDSNTASATVLSAVLELTPSASAR